MPILIALVAGIVFGLGLIVSGMADPTKVLGFLDLAGAWDPSLALVMAGAIAVGLVAFTFAARWRRSLLDLDMKLPTARALNAPLIFGSLLFGVGWGLVGLCPGPALVALGTGAPAAVTFVLAMLAGMALHTLLSRKKAPGRPQA